MLKRLLFETRVGERLLALLEHKAGLAVVDANWLSYQPTTRPMAMGEARQSHSPA